MTAATSAPVQVVPATQAAPAATPAPTATLDGERRSEVRVLARAVGIEGEQADQIIDRSATVEGAKAAHPRSCHSAKNCAGDQPWASRMTIPKTIGSIT